MNSPTIKLDTPARRVADSRTRLAQLFLICLSAFLIARGSAQDGIPGQPGVITAQDVANFSELARLEALNPPSPVQSRSNTIRRPSKGVQHLPLPKSTLSANPSPPLKTSRKAAVPLAGVQSQSLKTP